MLGDAGLGDVDLYIAVEQKDDEGNWLVEPTAAADPDATEDETEESQSTQSTTTSSSKPQFGGGFFDNKSGATTLQPRYKSGTTSSTPAVASTSKIATRSQTGSSSRVKGLTGLGNLGNTCVRDALLACDSTSKAKHSS